MNGNEELGWRRFYHHPLESAFRPPSMIRRRPVLENEDGHDNTKARARRLHGVADAGARLHDQPDGRAGAAGSRPPKPSKSSPVVARSKIARPKTGTPMGTQARLMQEMPGFIGAP